LMLGRNLIIAQCVCGFNLIDDNFSCALVFFVRLFVQPAHAELKITNVVVALSCRLRHAPY
jgi:hypothetical protein